MPIFYQFFLGLWSLLFAIFAFTLPVFAQQNTNFVEVSLNKYSLGSAAPFETEIYPPAVPEAPYTIPIPTDPRRESTNGPLPLICTPLLLGAGDQLVEVADMVEPGLRITLPKSGAYEINVWHKCNDPNVEGPPNFNTSVTAIDTNGKLIAGPFPVLSRVSPANGTGNCNTTSPCRTSLNVPILEIAAMSSIVANVGYEFVEWRTSGIIPSTELNLTPLPGKDDLTGGHLVVYKPTGIATDLSDLSDQFLFCTPRIRSRAEFGPGRIGFLTDNECTNHFDLDEICLRALDCPGCERGRCPGFDLQFAANLPLDILVLNSDGKVIVKGEPVGKNRLAISIKPRQMNTSNRQLSDRMFFAIVPQKDDKIKSGTREIDLQVGLKVSSK